MLCPDVITTADMICNAYNSILKTDSFTYGCINTSIGYLSPDPDWLQGVRVKMNMLKDECTKWMSNKPEIWSQLLLPFVNYYTLFKGFTEASKQFGDDREIWKSALQGLKKELNKGKKASDDAQDQFDDVIKEIQNFKFLLDGAINDGWSELANEEAVMLDIATELTSIQDKLNYLQKDISSAEISSGQDYAVSLCKISYPILFEASTAIPYLTIATLAFSIGSTIYDLVSKSKEINDCIDKICDLQVKATQEAQALAATKAVLKMLNDLELNLVALQKSMPDFESIWQNEIDKINMAINALNSGVSPNIYIDLKSMPVALATWETLAGFVPKLTQGCVSGKDINIEINR